MTEFITNAALGVKAPLVAKDKGDLSNRLNCTGAHIKNNAQTLVQDTVVIGGTALGAGVVAKSGKLNKVYNNIKGFLNKPIPQKIIAPFKQTVNSIKNSKCYTMVVDKLKGNKFINKMTKEISNTKGKVKKGLHEAGKMYRPFINKFPSLKKLTLVRKGALGTVIGLGALALGYVTNKHFYKAGQIDQKYTDKAAIEKRAKSPLE